MDKPVREIAVESLGDRGAMIAVIVALVRRAGGTITISQVDVQDDDEVEIVQTADGAITLNLRSAQR